MRFSKRWEFFIAVYISPAPNSRIMSDPRRMQLSAYLTSLPTLMSEDAESLELMIDFLLADSIAWMSIDESKESIEIANI